MLAKFTRPRTHKPLKRARLFKLLDHRNARSVVWINGPPGSGKSTLAASYLEARGIKALWFQVDEGNRDPATLFTYLREAVGSHTKRKKLPAFGADYSQRAMASITPT